MDNPPFKGQECFQSEQVRPQLAEIARRRPVQVSDVITEMLKHRHSRQPGLQLEKDLRMFILSNRNDYLSHISYNDTILFSGLGAGPKSQIMKDLQKKD